MAKNSRGSKLDTVIKLSLVFFISLLSFAVGTFVGKGVSDTEYKEMALESGEYKGFRGTASVDPAATEVTPESGLSEEDIESLTEEFVNAEKEGVKIAKNEGKHHGEGHAEESHNEPAHHETAHKEEHGNKHHDSDHSQNKADSHEKATEGYEKVERKGASTEHKAEPKKEEHAQKTNHHQGHDKHHKSSGAAERIANDKAPTKDAKKKRKPTSVLPSVASTSIGKYTVQVASYPDETEAKKHASSLEGKGFSAFYIPAKVKGNTWYRVSVGLFNNQSTANSFRKDLMKQADIKSAIVTKIVK
jgi:cell division protein FtsN